MGGAREVAIAAAEKLRVVEEDTVGLWRRGKSDQDRRRTETRPLKPPARCEKCLRHERTR